MIADQTLRAAGQGAGLLADGDPASRHLRVHFICQVATPEDQEVWVELAKTISAAS